MSRLFHNSTDIPSIAHSYSPLLSPGDLRTVRGAVAEVHTGKGEHADMGRDVSVV